MGNHDHSDLRTLLFLDFGDCILYFSFTLRVKSRGSFIKYKDLRVLDQSSCDGNALFLSTREVHHTARTHISVDSFLKIFDKSGISSLQSYFDVLLCRVFVAVQQIVTNGS